MFVDFILNGSGVGEAASVLEGCRFDPGLLRPYIETNPSSPLRGQRCVTVNTGRMVYDDKLRTHKAEQRKVRVVDLQAKGINSPVFNATSLRKEEWLELDRVVLRAARYRLRAWTDLSGANSFGGFNAMSKMILEHETMSDPGEAVVDMDGLTEGRTDAPKFQLEGLPLPLTHSDFWFSSRRLAVSRNSGTPLDTTMGEAAGRRVAEAIEKTTIGNQTGIIYGGSSTQTGGYGRTSQVYGYTTFPSRIVKTNLYLPTGTGRSGTGWVAGDTLQDVLAMRTAMYNNKFYGPFMLYHSDDWDRYLDNDYTLTTSSGVATQTLRTRLRAIEGIQDVRRLDFLFSAIPQTDPYWTSATVGTTGKLPYTGPGGENVSAATPFRLILVQMTSDVARAINGMDITTVQWESQGGMRVNFKVMAIQVPQLRADHYGNCGILDATATL